MYSAAFLPFRQDKGRDDLVSHSYDITYGTIVENVDTLVAVEDSIVRGTTLKKSILRMLNRLHPKEIVVVSSAPHIRYVGCISKDGVCKQSVGCFLRGTPAVDYTNIQTDYKNMPPKWRSYTIVSFNFERLLSLFASSVLTIIGILIVMALTWLRWGISVHSRPQLSFSKIMVKNT